MVSARQSPSLSHSRRTSYRRLWCVASVLVAAGTAHAQQPSAAPPVRAAAAEAAAKTAAPAAAVPDAGAVPATPAAPVCEPGNLIRTARVTGTALKGVARRATDGVLAMEGSEWSSPQATQLKTAESNLIIDLRSVRPIGFLALQGDNNDVYFIEGSTDGVTYKTLWAVPFADGQGLRTRQQALNPQVEARYLRIRPGQGDGFFSVSDVQAYCAQPTPWPLKLHVPPKRPGLLGIWDMIDNPNMVTIKGILGAVGLLVLLWGWFVRRRRLSRAHRIAPDVLLAIVGFVAFASWWNLGHFHFNHFVHVWEHYHYYMGAKYGPELRFARLYECTAAADIADGRRKQVKERKMRDLAETNELMTSDAIVADPTRCTKHFTPERWEAFRKDIRFFRGRFSSERWDQSQTDHGFNGTPVWAILGRLIADRVTLTWENIERMAYIDTVILVLMWPVVWWAFGWRAMCVALLYWGTNFPARWYWNGGSFLRYDWLVWMVVGLCCLKKERHFLGGMALTYSTLLRIFPGFVVAAVVLKALYRMVRERRFVLSRDHQIFAAGCLVAMAVLLPASAWATNGIDAWVEFAHNSRKHLHTALTNNMGMKTVLGYDFATRAKLMRNDNLIDPFGEWKNARVYFYAKRQPLLLALIFLFCVILARAGDREPDWSAAALGAGLIPIAAELTCYYYGFLLTYGLLWHRRVLPGMAAAALASATCWLSLIAWNDDHFGAMSLATTITVFAVTAHVAFGKAPPASS